MKQIAAFSYCEWAEIVAEVLPVQQPANCVDCGLFAIAGATSLSHNQNLVRQVYGTTKLRQHLVSCLDARKMSVFSSHSTNEKKTSTFNAIEIYCSRRMPSDNTREDDHMIGCTKCCYWYHGSCENITIVKKYKDRFCK